MAMESTIARGYDLPSGEPGLEPEAP
jgi:hypothetical protein